MRKLFTHSFTKQALTLALVVFGSVAMMAQMRLEITSPTSIARVYTVGVGSYGGNAIPEINGTLRMTETAEACDPVTNDLTGFIAVSDRGSCNFSIKAFEAQQAGAMAAIMCNNLDEVFNMARGTNAENVTIPHIMLSSSDCNQVQAAMAAGDVQARIFFDNWGFDDVLWGDGADGADFDEDFEDIGFTTVGISDALATWSRNDIPLTNGGCGSFFIQSPTANNGAAFMDADNFLTGGIDCAGDGPVNSELISPVIDCSSFDAVALRFWQFNLPIGIEESDTELGTSIQISLDGGTSWDNPINVSTNSEQNTNGNQYANSERILINIPEAAGAENFRFKLVYNRARGFYNWMVDDVALVRPPDYDVVLENSFYTPLSFATPIEHIATDTFGFSVNIYNAGVKADVPVISTVTILDDTGAEFMNQSDTRTLAAQARDTIIFSSIRPEFPVGNYTINYTIEFENQADEIPENNDYTYEFAVTNNLFSKELTDQADINSSTIETRTTSYFYGNFYTISNEATADERMFKAAELACGTADGLWDTEGFALYLLKYVDDGDGYPQLAELRTSVVSPINNHPNFEIVSFASVTNTGQLDNELFELSVDNLDWFDEIGNPLTSYELEAGATYALVAEFDNNVEIGLSSVNKDDDLAGFVGVLWNPQDEGLYFSGYNGTSAVLRMRIASNVSADDIELDDLQANVYPTLANDVVNVELNFNEMTETHISVVDMQGRVMAYNQVGEVSAYTYQQDVSDFAAGTYIVNIETALGQKQVQISVVK